MRKAVAWVTCLGQGSFQGACFLSLHLEHHHLLLLHLQYHQWLTQFYYDSFLRDPAVSFRYQDGDITTVFFISDNHNVAEQSAASCRSSLLVWQGRKTGQQWDAPGYDRGQYQAPHRSPASLRHHDCWYHLRWCLHWQVRIKNIIRLI